MTAAGALASGGLWSQLLTCTGFRYLCLAFAELRVTEPTVWTLLLLASDACVLLTPAKEATCH